MININISKTFFLTVMAFFVLSLLPIIKINSAFACIARRPLPPEEAELDIKKEFNESDAVFVGTVTSVKDNYNSFLDSIEFDVEKVYKGFSENKIVISAEPAGAGSCGWPFEKYQKYNQKYIVYAKYINDVDDKNIKVLYTEGWGGGRTNFLGGVEKNSNEDGTKDVLVLNNLTGSYLDNFNYLPLIISNKIFSSFYYFLIALIGGSVLIATGLIVIVYKIILRKKSPKIHSK